MLVFPAGAAWILLPFVAPICIWVACNDMAHMKIPNKAVMVLFAVYLTVGPIALPFDVWLWNWLHLVVVLAVGFFLNMAGGLGAGDAKFAAAAAPYIMLDDLDRFLMLFAVITLAGFLTHRAARATPAVRRRFPDWVSWTHKKFPMGLPLGAMLLFYLGLAAFGA